MKLFLLISLLIYRAESRHVSKSELFSGFVLRSSSEDLEVAAAQPRPVIVERNPLVLPLISDKNGFSDSAVSLASEKVEKILQHPLAFSYRNHDDDQTSEDTQNEEEKELDQKPAAVDYYKHIKNVEDAEREEGAANVRSEDEDKDKEEANVENEDVKNEDEEEYNSAEDSELEQYKVPEKDEDLSDRESEGVKEEPAANDEEAHAQGTEDHQSVKMHEDHKKEGGHGGSGNGSYKKGGGQEKHSGHKEEKGEKGDKKYEGHHHDEKGEKGHHTKEKHSKNYEEKGGEKKKHHHDDGYHAEHGQEEKGEKASKFKEYGEHSKGHSTKGEHNIHKKDEYEKKQEFYDESDEEDEFEKEGGFFHEDDFSKGGFEKGSFGEGAEEEAHHGKKHEYAKGGHYKETEGHKDAKGHDSHYDHDHKYGKKESSAGGKKWSHSKGDGGGSTHGHQHADESSSPIRIVRPDKKRFQKKRNSFDVIYPPLADSSIEIIPPEPLVRVTYEDDTPFMPILTPIQKRMDENVDEDENNQQLEVSEQLPQPLNKTKEEINEATLVSSIEVPFGEKLVNDDRSSEEIGAYSIYRIGNYSLPQSAIKPDETQSLEDLEELSTPGAVTTIDNQSSEEVSGTNTDHRQRKSSNEEREPLVEENNPQPTQVSSTSMEPIIVMEEDR